MQVTENVVLNEDLFVRLVFTLPLEIEEFEQLLSTQTSTQLFDDWLSDFLKLSENFSFRDVGTTVAADGVCDYAVTLDFGSAFHNLLAAMRTSQRLDTHGEDTLLT